MTIEMHTQFFPHDFFTSGDLSAEISRPRRGRPLPAADSFLPERDPGSACRHLPSRAVAAMGHHDRFRSKLAAGFEAQRKEANLDGEVLLSVWTEDETSASRRTAAATESCIGRSMNAMEHPQPPLQRRKPSPASLLRKRQHSPRVVPSAFLLKYFHRVAPAQLFHYFLYSLERPTIPVTNLPTLPRPRMPSLISCTL